MRFEYINIDDIVFSGHNANVMSDSAFDRLVREIKETGFIVPVIVYDNGGYYTVIDGEHRLKALKVLGYDKVACIVVDDERFKSSDFAKLVSIRLNVLRGQIDPIKFVEYYNDYVEKYGLNAVQEILGFTDEVVWKHLKDSVSKILSMSSGLPRERVSKARARLKKAKTLDQIADILSQVYESYGMLEDKGILVFSFSGVDMIYFLVDKGLFEILRSFAKYIDENGIDVNTALKLLFSDWEDMLSGLQNNGEDLL